MAFMLSVSDEFIIIITKGKAFLVHALKSYRESRGVAPLIHNLGTTWRSVVNLMLRSLYHEGPPPPPLGAY